MEWRAASVELGNSLSLWERAGVRVRSLAEEGYINLEVASPRGRSPRGEATKEVWAGVSYKPSP